MGDQLIMCEDAASGMQNLVHSLAKSSDGWEATPASPSFRDDLANALTTHTDMWGQLALT